MLCFTSTPESTRLSGGIELSLLSVPAAPAAGAEYETPCSWSPCGLLVLLLRHAEEMRRFRPLL